MRYTIAMFLFSLAFSANAGCINGMWDPDFTWIKDCTPNLAEGRYGKPAANQTTSGEVKFKVGSENHTLSWRLHYFKASVPGAIVRDSVPLILGLHPWSEGMTIDALLNIQSSLMEYEGSWEDVIFLTVALETGNNLGTWWDGKKVDGKPQSWAMDAIIELLKGKLQDATTLLNTAGATELANRKIDPNRVYVLGASMGGTGTFHIGLKHPEIFAAIHSDAGFADYDGGPCGNENFCKVFTSDFIGTVEENLTMPGLDGKPYPARKYTNMSWFVGEHNGASWTASLGNGKPYEPPYIHITHGKADPTVHISSANRLVEVLKKKHFGYSYFRHNGGHANYNFAHLNWLLGFRLNKSYLALTNNSTDIVATPVDSATKIEQFNQLDKIGWNSAAIIDKPEYYEVKMIGVGKTDVTLRRLQEFKVVANKPYRYWLNSQTGEGTQVVSDSSGVLTIPGVSVATMTTLIIQPEGIITGVEPKGKKAPKANPSGLRNRRNPAYFPNLLNHTPSLSDLLGKDVSSRGSVVSR